MRLVFAGTPGFAECALSALTAAGHDVALVLTQPDRPAGRGMRLHESPVKRLAHARGIEVFQPSTLKDAAAQSRVCAVDAEALVVAAYGLILPAPLLTAAPRGAINIHASLLPRWRGAAPIQRALLAGDERSGITIMQMDEGLDTGPILLQRAFDILPTDDAGTLHQRLADLGASMIVEVLARDELRATAQPTEGVTRAAKVTREDAVLDWRRSADELERVVRAMRPAPGAQAAHGADVLKVWRAEVAPRAGNPGTVLSADSDGIIIACGEGALRLLEVQRPGGRRLTAAEFLHGSRITAGERLQP